MGGSSGSGSSASASLVFRIATVGLSLASAIMTAASTQCVYRDNNGVPAAAGTVSYADYPSFKYSAVADLVSAVLQGVAIYLEATRKDRAARAVELVDKLVQALTATSAALLLAVDDITSCGGPPRGGGRGRQRQSNLCGQAGAFCGRVRVSSAFSISATVSVSVSVYTRHAPVAATILAPRPPPPPPSVTYVNVNAEGRDEDKTGKKKREEEKKGKVVELMVPVPEKKTEEVKTGEDTEGKEKKKDQDQVKKDEEGGKEKKKKDKEEQCSSSTLQILDFTPPATMPPPWCR